MNVDEYKEVYDYNECPVCGSTNTNNIDIVQVEWARGNDGTIDLPMECMDCKASYNGVENFTITTRGVYLITDGYM